MDPAITADLLGKGGAQVVLAVVVVALGLVGWKLASALIDSYRERLTETRDVIRQQSADTKVVADALRDIKAAVDLLAAALKGRS